MRIGSEAPKRRTHSSNRHESQGACRESATSNHHRLPSQVYGQGRNCRGSFSVLHSLCRTQNDAVRYNALPHEPPQGDQKLARQGHDHGFASAASVLGAGSKPLCQGAVLLEHEQPPRQLNHASSNPSIARTGQPFLSALPPALVGRASEAGITRYGPSVAHVSRLPTFPRINGLSSGSE